MKLPEGYMGGSRVCDCIILEREVVVGECLTLAPISGRLTPPLNYSVSYHAWSVVETLTAA